MIALGEAIDFLQDHKSQIDDIEHENISYALDRFVQLESAGVKLY